MARARVKKETAEIQTWATVVRTQEILAGELTRSTGEAPLTETGIYSRARLRTCNEMGSADC